MAAIAKLTSIGILVVSFFLAILFYYVMSQKSKAYKYKTIEYMTSTLINFVIYIWVAKIVLRISTFFKDPLAVLAYPSDSRAFYLATVLLIAHLIYRGRKDSHSIQQASDAFVPIFLSASFIYEFIIVMTKSSSLNFAYLGLLFILLIVLFSRFGQEKTRLLHVSLMIAWAIGTLVLSLILPYITIFGYLISPVFISLGLIVFISLLIYKQRKVVR